MVTLDQREASIVLYALRVMQQHIGDTYVDPELYEILGDEESATEEEIDELCERINFDI